MSVLPHLQQSCCRIQAAWGRLVDGVVVGGEGEEADRCDQAADLAPLAQFICSLRKERGQIGGSGRTKYKKVIVVIFGSVTFL